MSFRLALAASLIAWGGNALAQDSPAAAGVSPLGVRQQRVERMMEEAERKLVALKLAIQTTEPERAERLTQALHRAKELLVQKRMDEMVRLLDRAQLDSALEGQRAIMV